MKLEKLLYSEYEGEPKEWAFEECTFGDMNLIVGKNATGKTRTLNVIGGLGDLFSDSRRLQWQDGNYVAEFSSGARAFVYAVKYSERTVLSEELRIDGEECLTRGPDGIGSIYAERLGQKIDFQTQRDRLALVAKKDSIQHPFIDDLYNWGQGILRLNFGTQLGKDHLAVKASDLLDAGEGAPLNLKDTDQIVPIFLQAQKTFGTDFKKAVISDMQSIGYAIDDIGADAVTGMSVIGSPIPVGRPTGTYVKETDLQARTEQVSISQGMFRAFSTFIQLNYGILSEKLSCVLIDDIGEGLDYGRSSALVKRVIDKLNDRGIQLFMATNDRFIMNAVPLEYWIILVRKGQRISNLNYRNSKDMFDDFEATGLSNFDLLSSDYYSRPK